jgi:hypothetical protein
VLDAGSAKMTTDALTKVGVKVGEVKPLIDAG